MLPTKLNPSRGIWNNRTEKEELKETEFHGAFCKQLKLLINSFFSFFYIYFVEKDHAKRKGGLLFITSTSDKCIAHSDVQLDATRTLWRWWWFFFQRTWLSTVFFATPVPYCWIIPFAVSITAQITAVSRFLERSVSSIEQRNRRKSALNRRKSSHLTLLHKAIHGESALEIPC